MVGPHRLRMLETGTRRRYLPVQLVQRAIRDDVGRHHGAHLQDLTHHDVLRAGLLVECPRCRLTNFVLPDELGRRLRCERCLEIFDLPQDRPPREWAYRPAGPFAIPGYAGGAYATLLAIAALGGSRHDLTWAPSSEVEGLGELDFVLWRRPRFRLADTSAPEFVIGEAKTFDGFQEQDVRRLLGARSLLGQGWLCFATLRDELEPSERRRLRAAVRRLGGGANTAPLMVLTAHELWSRDLVEALAQRNEEFGLKSSPAAVTHVDLEALAAVTQAAYL
jgi:hypothetical protein